jgi:hypothetical protein
VCDPDDREGDDAHQHPDREQVLDEAQHRRVADPRDGEGRAEQVAIGLQDRQQQDDEAPERQRVGDARHGPLEQLALADDLGGLGPDVPARVRADRRDTLGSGLPGPGDPVQPPQPASRQGKRGNGESQADDDAQGHADLPGDVPCQRTPWPVTAA